MGRFERRFAIAMATAFLGLALLPAPSAQAVQLDPGGLGQVLIYPYYTVHEQQQTLMSITNVSDAEQVLQVTFREALNGRAVLQFKVWLGRSDIWSGTVFALADDGIASEGAGILTRDPSCTTPLFSTGAVTTGGASYFPFRADNYSGAMSDGGPTSLDRTRHGWIEVISLSNVTGFPARDITISGATGMPINCAGVQNLLPTSAGLGTKPSGGLVGTSSVIRVAAGTVLSSRAEAISGFSDISLFNDPMLRGPDLSSVNQGAPGSAVSAKIVDEQGGSRTLTYGGPGASTRPVDAVTAVLMSSRVRNDFQIDSSLGGSTDWVMTMPTKPFYTDPAIIGASSRALPPFEEPFGAPGHSRLCTPYRTTDQNQTTGVPTLFSGCNYDPLYFPLLQPRYFTIFQAANVVPFKQATSTPLRSGVLSAPQPAGTSSPMFPWYARPFVGAAGWMDVNLAANVHRLPASAEGNSVFGLPMVGFSATVITNGNVSNGVLANYAYAVRHATSVICVKAFNQACD